MLRQKIALQQKIAGRYSLRSALGLALGGIPGVLVAAFLVKSLPIEWLRWLVSLVVLYAAALMLHSAAREQTQGIP